MAIPDEAGMPVKVFICSKNNAKPVKLSTFLCILQIMPEPSESGKTPGRPPNCLKCAHFKVSWDTDFPRSCEIFGIKCRNLPSMEVFRAAGGNCPSFRLKEGLK
jgi:hypothetical protein